jgi:hypothetical protein
MTDDKPVRSYTRLVPFSMRPAIRDQTHQLIEDDDIEISDLPFINPLTVVPREGKSPRICVDARRTNALTQPDRAKTPPLHELFQRFHRISFMSSIDLSSAFLQSH